MASKTNSKYAVRVEYKPSYDPAGLFDLPAYTQTFTHVSETATLEQLRSFARALMSLTVYKDTPYKTYIIDTFELVAD